MRKSPSPYPAAGGCCCRAGSYFHDGVEVVDAGNGRLHQNYRAMRAVSAGERRSARFVEQCADMLRERRLILVSNRGPVEYHLTPEGNAQARRGSGGVVTALSTLTNYVDLTWVASAMGEGDRRVAQQAEDGRIKSPLPGQSLYLRYVVTPRRVYHKFYNIFCNPLLWFLQHYMWSSPYTPNVDSAVYDAWGDGYVAVNRSFADAVVDEARHSASPPYVMLHDYHLYLAPGMVRAELPDALIQHFLHIPWPDPSYWQMLRPLCGPPSARASAPATSWGSRRRGTCAASSRAVRCSWIRPR